MKTTTTKKIDTYGNPPKTLVAACQRHAEKIREIGDERGSEDGYWVYLEHGWINPVSGTHAIHEWTVADCISQLSSLNPCNCQDCQRS